MKTAKEYAERAADLEDVEDLIAEAQQDALEAYDRVVEEVIGDARCEGGDDLRSIEARILSARPKP